MHSGVSGGIEVYFGKRRPIGAALVILIMAGALTGCAEFNRRGGFVAQVEDTVLFHARTKSHRLLRSYVLMAGLVAVARNVGMGEAEKSSISGRLKGALAVAQEAYDCLYPDRARIQWHVAKALPETVSAVRPTPCIFFDERMARLDYAIYKLAADVMIDPDSQALFADVRDRMIGNVPVFGSAVRTATKALEATEEATGVLHETASLANSLIRLSFRSSRRYIYLAPIYRDALELDMRLVIDGLRESCPTSGNPDECQKMVDSGRLTLNDGDSDLREWRKFLGSANSNNFAVMVEAYPQHFAYVSRWLFYSCSALYAGDLLAPGKAKINVDAGSIASIVKVVENIINDTCAPLIEYRPLSTDPRFKVAYTGGTPNPELINVMRRLPKPRPMIALDPAAKKARGEVSE